MTLKFRRFICAFMAVLMLIAALPSSVSAASCSHVYKKTYTVQNERQHSYISSCTKCGYSPVAAGYCGWEDHTFGSSGKCTLCGYCRHSKTEKTCSFENASQHSFSSVCKVCGAKLTGAGYCGWENHTFSGDRCTGCGYTKVCAHPSTKTGYSSLSSAQHKKSTVCRDCGISYNSVTEAHSWTYGTWSEISSSQHRRTVKCVCGESRTETADHTFSGNTCTGCGYTKKTAAVPDAPAVTASVSLSASGPNGTLGAAGGELTAGSSPASYTVKASASGCSVTKISYVYKNRVYSVNGSSVTVTADTDSDFTSTTFTAYTDTAGVTATFTVNFKIVRRASSQVMWRTSSEAVIRSITGNGMAKTLSHSMVIPNSYDVQSDLTSAQLSEIQGLIGKKDGKTYMICYTRTIWVYTPAEYSDTGKEKILGSFDGNNSSDMNTCLNRWGWNTTSAEAIRQAACSYLAFTTPLPVSCAAVWTDTSSGKQVFTKSFGNDALLTPSNSIAVSVSYTDWSKAGEYVYESLSYSGDTSGNSTKQTYSQTYTVNSKPLTVTFYCHPVSASGSITVKAVDGDTEEIMTTASVTCDGKTGASNPCTFTDCSFGKHKCTASAPGYGSAEGTVTNSGTSPDRTIILKLYRQGGDITVTVKDSQTLKAIPGASVNGAKTSKTTDANGSVHYSGLSYGSYTFTASKAGYYSNTGTAEISGVSKTTAITIYLDPIPQQGRVTVTVKDSVTGLPIGGASVTGAGTSAMTGDDGTAVFGSVPMGSCTFTASKTGYYPGSGTAYLTEASPYDEITIFLGPVPVSGDITVKVIDSSSGREISGASVKCGSSPKMTGNDGTAVFGGLSYGSYTFTASKTGYGTGSASASVSSSSPSAEVIIRLTPDASDGTVTVYVRDRAGGSPLAGARVSSGSYTGTTDSSGAKTFTGMPFGSYAFTASLGGYSDGTVTAGISGTAAHASVTVYLDRIRTDLSVNAAVNGTVYKGSEITVSVNVTNAGSVPLTPGMPAAVDMTAKDGSGSVISSQTNTVIIPADESSLTWFTLTVPDTDSMKIYFTVSAPSGVNESDLTDNTYTLTVPVSALPARNCTDAGLDTDVPADFSGSVCTGSETPELTWSVWEWNGGFVKKTYSAKLDISASLVPDESAGYRRKNGGVWTTRSGYGVDTEVTADAVTASSAVTGELKVDVFYPEHNYSSAVKRSDRLELLSGKYVFRTLTSSVGGKRMHTVPLWYPDGSYSVKYYAYDLWCPAGMLTGYTCAKVMISGDMYDDLYTN